MPYPEHLAEARRLAKECIADAKKQGISKKELDEDLLKDLVSELKDRLDADGEPTLIPDAANTRLKAQSKSTDALVIGVVMTLFSDTNMLNRHLFTVNDSYGPDYPFFRNSRRRHSVVVTWPAR